eukprot:TRINITY_DN542_c0_g1_i1.p1 TRINITY_DN542_c0_g1~~TRINITY_DN542_c0_g1_i1.p1  ORF type:complete len:126 (-),score=50.22 TRINITY_DN542_c0_g1_i1:45-422(-)
MIKIKAVVSTQSTGEQADLEAFVNSLGDWVPTIPDEVTTYMLSRTGFQCPDVRVKRLVALAAQKFVADVAYEALRYARIRQTTPSGKPPKDKKNVMTMEDLAQALKEVGISVIKPEYYADKPAVP